MRDDRTYQTEPYMPQNPDSNVGDEYIVKRNPNLIEIPDNATNGEVIKAMFPELRFGTKYTYSVCVKLPYHSEHDTGLLFDKDWWNAPYERR